MMATTFSLMALPLELFRAILAEAMHVRRLKRALRLRLVDRFFAAEVMRMLLEDSFLKDYGAVLSTPGTTVGADFMAYRILHGLPVCASWERIGRVARRLAQEEKEEEKDTAYITYIKLLCRRAAQVQGVLSIKDLCNPNYIGTRHQSCPFEYDLTSAAALTNKLSIIDELGNSEENLVTKMGTFGNPYMSAVEGNNHEALDLLLAKRQQIADDGLGTRLFLVSRVTTHGSLSMFEKFLPLWQSPHVREHSEELRKLKVAMHTPSVEIFEVLRHIKEKATCAEMEKDHLLIFLMHACKRGWDEMVKHLLSLGVPVRVAEQQIPIALTFHPSETTTEHDLKKVMRVLLDNDMRIEGALLEAALKKQYWDAVWMLIDEYGVNPNWASTPPIVFAVEQERKDMFFRLREKGAILRGNTAKRAVEVAKKKGLESMLALLEEQGVNVTEG